MAEFTKTERALLRDLADEAYERELGTYLAELYKSFGIWRRGQLVSSELAKEIHEFHQHAAREVWSAYQLPHTGMIVARAVAMGLLKRQELPKPLLEKLADELAVFKKG